ncbi:MAG: right-handed parallel beta-helix repeat-containing protein [Chitinophagales bacterium]
MKKKFTGYCLLLLLLVNSSFATNYYFSNNGNDSNIGTSTTEPWQTINQLNTVQLQPGDSILFLTANTFRGQITIYNGGDESNPVYFGTYGGIVPAIITGAEIVANWNPFSDTVYTTPFYNTPAQLFANSSRMVIARYPNSGYLIHQMGIGDTGFVDTTLTQAAHYWDSAGIRVRTTNRLYEYNRVSRFSGDSIYFVNNSFVAIENGYGYYLDNVFLELDTAGEWYYDTNTQLLYFYPPAGTDPNQLVVEASIYEYGILFENGAGYCTIENLQFEKCSRSGIASLGSVTQLIVRNCQFISQGEDGIALMNGASESEVTGTTFKNIAGAAFTATQLSATLIAHNEISNIGLYAGYGINTLQQGIGISIDEGNEVTVSENNIDSTGNSSVNVNGLKMVIEKNNCTYSLLHFNNQGSIYSYGSNSDSVIIRSNIVQYVIGSNEATSNAPINASGIFLDEQTNHYQVENNTVAFANSYGVCLFHGGTDHMINGNVIFGCNNGALRFEEGIIGSNNNHIVTGNTFYSLNEYADIVSMISTVESFAPASFDSNYYFNPYNYFSVRKQLLTSPEPQDHYYTLSQWKSIYGGDSGSKETFFFRNRFIATDSIGANLIDNGAFTNNTDGWNNGTPDNLWLLLDNTTLLDYGCMKLITFDDQPYNYGEAYYGGVTLESNGFYQLRFSCYSMKEGNIGLFQKQSEFPYLTIALARYFPFSTVRKDYQTVFSYDGNGEISRLVTHLLYEDSIIWLDNFSIIKTDALYEDPLKKSRLFVNSSATTIVYDLSDSVFYDLDQNTVAGQLLVPPYSSTILIFDSSLITTSHEPVAPSPNHSTLFIYPSLTTVNDGINIACDNLSDQNCVISITDLQGRQVFTKIFQKPLQLNHIQLPATLLPGAYFATMVAGKYNATGKFILK